MDNNKRLVFQAAQPIFSEFLTAASNEERMLQLLNQAHTLLERDIMVRAHIGTCLDYFLFPFQFMMESIAAIRTTGKIKSPAVRGAVAVESMKSSAAAERALECVHLVLSLSQLTEAPQLVGLVTRFAELVNMSGNLYDEDLMLRVLRALRAMLETSTQSDAGRELFQELWSEEHMVAIGYLLHGLMAVAQREKDLGSGGANPNACAAWNYNSANQCFFFQN